MDKLERRIMIIMSSKTNERYVVLGVVFRARWIDGMEVAICDELNTSILADFLKNSKFYGELKTVVAAQEIYELLLPCIGSLELKSLNEMESSKLGQVQAILNGIVDYLRGKI